MKLYQEISQQLHRYENNNLDIHNDAKDKLSELEKLLPSGSGVDRGSEICLDSSPNKIYIRVSFHHMDEHGGYDGWTDHIITVVPNFLYNIDLKISGRNRNQIKDYLYDIFYESLKQEIK